MSFISITDISILTSLLSLYFYEYYTWSDLMTKPSDILLDTDSWRRNTTAYVVLLTAWTCPASIITRYTVTYLRIKEGYSTQNTSIKNLFCMRL